MSALSVSLPMPVSNTGLTLPELLWAIAILGILIVAGIPALTALVGRYEAESSFRAFRNVASYARAEAIVRKSDIVLCPRIEGDEQCFSGAISNDTDEEKAWRKGWLLFVDRGNTPKNIDPDQGDILLKVFDPVRGDVDMKMGGSTGGGQLSYIRFMSRGNTYPSNPSALFCYQDDDDVHFGGKIVISQGRVRMEDVNIAVGECDAL